MAQSINLWRLTAPLRKPRCPLSYAELKQLRDKLIKVQLTTGTNCSGYLKQIAERIRLLDKAVKSCAK